MTENRERVERALRGRQQRQRRLRMLLGAGSALAVLGVAGVGFQFLRGGGAPAPGAAGIVPVARTTQVVAAGCAKPAELTIATPPAMALAFSDVIKAFQTQPSVPCATFTIEPREAAAVAQSIAGPVRPDAWVTDAGLWLDQANSRAGLGLTADEAFASSPVVVAMSEDAAAQTEGTGWADLATKGPTLVLDDPATSTVGLLSLAAAAGSWQAPVLDRVVKRSNELPAGTAALAAAADPGRAAAAPVTRAELISYNAANPEPRLAAVAPAEGVASVRYSLVAVADGTVASRVLRSLRDFLASNAAREVVAAHGFNGPDDAPDVTPTSAARTASATASPHSSPNASATLHGTPKALPQPDLATAEKLRDAWTALDPAPNAVLALDVSAGALTRLDGETILSRLGRAAQDGIGALPDRATVSVWLYGGHLGPKGEDHRVIAESGSLTRPDQIQSIAKGLGTMPKIVGGGRGLYDTIIAATQAAAAQSKPGDPATAVVVSAGPNDDDFGASLGVVKKALAQIKAKNTGVRLVIIGVGDKVEGTLLREVAAVVGGTYEPVTTGNELTPAISSALAGRP